MKSNGGDAPKFWPHPLIGGHPAGQQLGPAFFQAATSSTQPTPFDSSPLPLAPSPPVPGTKNILVHSASGHCLLNPRQVKAPHAEFGTSGGVAWRSVALGKLGPADWGTGKGGVGRRRWTWRKPEATFRREVGARVWKLIEKIKRGSCCQLGLLICFRFTTDSVIKNFFLFLVLCNVSGIGPVISVSISTRKHCLDEVRWKPGSPF